MHELNDHTRHLLDAGTWILAGVAAFSLAQAALVITMLAGIASFILASIRIYDRIRFGRSQ
jgi:hypothetical protein